MRSAQRDIFGRYKNYREEIPNYIEDEIKTFLDILEKVKEYGAHLWERVERTYGNWAAANDRITSLVVLK